MFLFVCKYSSCTFDRNTAISGSAVQVISYSRVDIASLPIEIDSW